MIKRVLVGDITDPALNFGDIIIAMNSRLAEASALGRPFVRKLAALHGLELGTVLTFKFDETRQLHMLICHVLGYGGWADAEKFVRFGMDYLWQSHGDRQYAAVQIGDGPVGRRDGADVPLIMRAMADSFLDLDLVIRPDTEEARAAAKLASLGDPVRRWSMGGGEEEIPGTLDVKRA